MHAHDNKNHKPPHHNHTVQLRITALYVKLVTLGTNTLTLQKVHNPYLHVYCHLAVACDTDIIYMITVLRLQLIHLNRNRHRAIHCEINAKTSAETLLRPFNDNNSTTTTHCRTIAFSFCIRSTAASNEPTCKHTCTCMHTVTTLKQCLHQACSQ